MKRLITLILIIALAVPAAAAADLPDISGLTLDELVQLKDKINLAMWNSQDWQEVTVPVGVWTIGEDIPAGKWNLSVSPDSKKKTGHFIYCDLLDETGTTNGKLTELSFYVGQNINRKDNDDGKYPTSLDIEQTEGNYLIIEGAPFVFTPPQGKPDLGLK